MHFLPHPDIWCLWFSLIVSMLAVPSIAVWWYRTIKAIWRSHEKD